jgi:hypothetical protein
MTLRGGTGNGKEQEESTYTSPQSHFTLRRRHGSLLPKLVYSLLEELVHASRLTKLDMCECAACGRLEVLVPRYLEIQVTVRLGYVASHPLASRRAGKGCHGA